MENQNENQDSSEPTKAWRAVITTFVISWVFIPAALLFKAAGWGHGARAYIPYAGFELLLKGLFLYVGSFFFLVFPTAYLLYNENSESYRGLPRVMLVTVLMLIPVLSFAYSLGNFRETLDYSETAVSLGVAIFTQVLIFESTRSVLVFSVGTALGLFMPLFVVNELLGPFFVYFTYAPQDMTIYWLHRLSAGAALTYCFWHARGAIGHLFLRGRKLRHNEG